MRGLTSFGISGTLPEKIVASAVNALSGQRWGRWRIAVGVNLAVSLWVGGAGRELEAPAPPLRLQHSLRNRMQHLVWWRRRAGLHVHSGGYRTEKMARAASTL